MTKRNKMCYTAIVILILFFYFMKKRILGTGVALLMATNIFANAVSAQGLDGENTLTEAKKTTEENITLSAAPVIRGTAWQLDSA